MSRSIYTCAWIFCIDIKTESYFLCFVYSYLIINIVILTLYHLLLFQSSPDKGGELESIRQLRDIASLGGHLDATLALCKSYAAGKYGGISYRQAAAFVREFVQSAKPTNLQDIFAWNVDITHSMRYMSFEIPY